MLPSLCVPWMSPDFTPFVGLYKSRDMILVKQMLQDNRYDDTVRFNFKL